MIDTRLLSSVVMAIGLFGPGQEKVKLEFKHEEESSSTIESRLKTRQILSIGGTDRESGSERSATVTRTVGKRGSDGRLPIQQRIDALAVQMLLGAGVTISFDSANPNAKHDDPMIQALLDTFRARVGSQHTIILGKGNKVIGIEGTENVLQRASPAAAEILRAEVNVEQMKKAAEEGFAILPSEPVGRGDSWTRTSTLRIGGGQTLTFETRFEYLGTVEKDGTRLDRISMAATAVTYAVEENSPFHVPESKLKIDSSKGLMLFDRAKGQTIESSALTHITGDMTFLVNGMEFPAKLDLTFDSSSSVLR